MTELMKSQNGTTFDDMQKQAALLVKSGFLPASIKTSEQALTIMLTGKELGLGLMESLRSINVVQGRPCMSAQLLIALSYRTKEVEQAFIKESTALKAVYVLKRKGQPAYESIITREEADKACFSRVWDKDKNAYKAKDNWEKQPGTMLLWRAMSKAARVVFPDAICGLYTPEEIAEGVDVAEDSTGTVTVAEIHEATTPEPARIEQANDAKESAEGLSGADVPDDSLGNYVIQFGKYKGMRLTQIMGQVTDKGENKGLEYLEWFIGQESKTENGKKAQEVISRFLNLMIKD